MVRLFLSNGEVTLFGEHDRLQFFENSISPSDAMFLRNKALETGNSRKAPKFNNLRD